MSDVPEEAEIEAALAGYHEWVAAGRPGALTHEEAMAELLGGGEQPESPGGGRVV
jgi:hypothetical protein